MFEGFFAPRLLHCSCIWKELRLCSFPGYLGRYLRMPTMWNTNEQYLFKKETQAQVFSCESCEISKNSFLKEHPPGDCFYDVLHDFVPFFQLKKNVKHRWRSVSFTKSDTPHGCFFTFFNLYKRYQIAQNISHLLRFWCGEPEDNIRITLSPSRQLHVQS